MRRKRELKIAVSQNVGQAYSEKEKARLLEAARASKSPRIYPALCLALSAGLRDAEIRNLQLGNVHLDEQFLVVGKSKTEAGEGRTIPLNASLFMGWPITCAGTLTSLVPSIPSGDFRSR